VTVASINGFAFTCHPSIAPIIKEHNDPKNNRKAIFMGYGLTMFLYTFVGVAGSLAIYGLKPVNTANIMDYFVGQWQAPVIGLTTVLYLLIVFPIFPYVSKNQLTGLFAKETRETPRFKRMVRYIFFAVWICVNTGFTLTEANPKVIMGFIGAVVSSYFTYFLPVMMVFTMRGLFSKGKTTN
jgi:amino acid permease